MKFRHDYHDRLCQSIHFLTGHRPSVRYGKGEDDCEIVLIEW